MRSFPPDVVVLDETSLTHARFARGKRNPRLVQAKSYRLPAGTFTSAPVTPSIGNEEGLAEALRRMRLESGRFDRVSILMPDSWFRISIVELPSFNDRQSDAPQIVRWSLKRTVPIPPEELRVAWQVLSRTPSHVQLLVVSAVEATLAGMERLFNASDLSVALIEPLGLNLWNAITVRERDTTKDRLFLYARDDEFTTAVFRGDSPLFIRSRDLSGDRTLEQEIRISASYLRDTLRTDTFETCYIASSRAAADLGSVLQSEFSSPIRMIQLREFVDPATPSELPPLDAELAACTGVFAG